MPRSGNAGRSGLLSGGTRAAGIVIAGCAALWVAASVAARHDDSRESAERGPAQIDPTEEPNALQVAVTHCDVDAVAAELDKGGRPFVGGRFSFDSGTSLQEALECGPAMAALLARYGVENDGGDPVLQAAVGRGDPSMVAAVLEAGADVDGVDDAGDSALIVAATGGQAPIVEQLLAAGADPGLANEAGHTPLVRAVGTGRADLVELLLAAGASTEAEVEVGTVELLVGLPDDADTIDELQDQLELAAEVFGGEMDANGLPSRTWGTARPLFIAAAQGDAEIVRLLLQAGADTTVAGGLAGNLPVDAARIMGHDDVVALFDD